MKTWTFACAIVFSYCTMCTEELRGSPGAIRTGRWSPWLPLELEEHCQNNVWRCKVSNVFCKQFSCRIIHFVCVFLCKSLEATVSAEKQWHQAGLVKTQKTRRWMGGWFVGQSPKCIVRITFPAFLKNTFLGLTWYWFYYFILGKRDSPPWNSRKENQKMVH